MNQIKQTTSPKADINLSELNDIGDIDISDKPK